MKNPRIDKADIYEILKKYRVGRHPKVISEQLFKNFAQLESDQWSNALKQCNRLREPQPRDIEASVADYLKKTLIGIGPKQARNILQALYLTRYEIPIDSRVMNWLNRKLSFPFIITSNALSDPSVYNLILDGICALCEECKIFQCLLDAAIFGAGDQDDWDDELQRY